MFPTAQIVAVKKHQIYRFWQIFLQDCFEVKIFDLNNPKKSLHFLKFSNDALQYIFVWVHAAARYLLDNREVQIEWQYATEPGGQAEMAAILAPDQQLWKCEFFQVSY